MVHHLESLRAPRLALQLEVTGLLLVPLGPLRNAPPCLW